MFMLKQVHNQQTTSRYLDSFAQINRQRHSAFRPPAVQNSYKIR